MKNLPVYPLMKRPSIVPVQLALRSFDENRGPFGPRRHVPLEQGVPMSRLLGERRFVLLALTCAIVLLALGYAARDIHLVERLAQLRLHVAVAMSGHSSHVVRSAPSGSGKHAAQLPGAAVYLFQHSGKQPRADRYVALQHSRTMDQPPTAVAAALAPMISEDVFGAPSPTIAVVERLTKTDRLYPGGASLVSRAAFDLGTSATGRASAAFFLMTPSELAISDALAETSADVRKPWPGDQHLSRLMGEDQDALFGGMTEAEFRAREMRCMATALYFEARGEPREGQIAVGQVIMNRVRSSYYPDTICGVIYQGHRNLNACQFSFACDGKPDKPTDMRKWAVMERLAREITAGQHWLDDIGYATHYHATYVRPAWARPFQRVRKIGQHIFYVAPNVPVQVADSTG
jgi:hypothetical protein